MGTMHHHAIIVTSWAKESLHTAHTKACELMPHVSGVVEGVVNGQVSFAVLPDGSKEWWSTSDEADEARAALIQWMDGKQDLEYAVVSFGELAATLETNCHPQEAP